MEVAVAKERLERKNTEAATLKRQNTAVSARLKASTAVVDNDIMDEAAGQARIAAAAASEERRKNEQAFMQKRNKDMRDRVRRAGSIARSDDNIDDEAAGIARIAMREASHARRAAERKELARANAAQRAALAATQAGTDFTIDDDEAGRYRAVKAEEARVRREREAEQLKQHALNTRARILAVKAVTDVDRRGVSSVAPRTRHSIRSAATRESRALGAEECGDAPYARVGAAARARARLHDAQGSGRARLARVRAGDGRCTRRSGGSEARGDEGERVVEDVSPLGPDAHLERILRSPRRARLALVSFW